MTNPLLQFDYHFGAKEFKKLSSAFLYGFGYKRNKWNPNQGLSQAFWKKIRKVLEVSCDRLVPTEDILLVLAALNRMKGRGKDCTSSEILNREEASVLLSQDSELKKELLDFIWLFLRENNEGECRNLGSRLTKTAGSKSDLTEKTLRNWSGRTHGIEYSTKRLVTQGELKIWVSVAEKFQKQKLS